MRVVVAGAGFAGLAAAKSLERAHDVTVVAPAPQFVFVPLIPEVLAGRTAAGDVVRPLDELLRRARVVHGRAIAVDGSTLRLASGAALPFDRLIVAIGAQAALHDVPGVREHAWPLYGVGDALHGHARLAERAAIRDRVDVVVCGASFTGVEAAGAAAALLDDLGCARRVTLVEHGPGIFPHEPEKFRAAAHRALDRMGLHLRTDAQVDEVASDGVRLAGGDLLPSDVTFWCAGEQPRTLRGLEPDVRPTLQSTARDDVFLCGDAARFPEEQHVPRLAQTAGPQGELVAHNILHPERMRTYNPRVLGTLLSVGPDLGVAQLPRGPVLEGRLPREVKHLLYRAKLLFA